MEVKMDEKQKQMLDDVFDAFTMLAGGSIVSLMHVEGKMTRYTPSAVELFGLPGEYIPDGAMNWLDWVHPEDRKRYLDVMLPLTTGESQTYDLTYRVRTKSGQYISYRLKGAVLRNEEGKPSLIGGMMVNEGMQENTDPVTILPNKYRFLEDVNGLIRKDKKVVALLLGYSGMSRLNAVHGYSFGNRVLQQVGWLIQETVNGRGEIYRMDDATFAVVTTDHTEEETAALYDALRIRLQRGISIDNVRLNLMASGGLVSTLGSQMDAGTLLVCLKYAYRESKLRMHGELVDFNGSAGYDGDKGQEIVSAIRSDILGGLTGFSLEYQPVLRTANERLIGVEALLRWTSEEFGTVAPLDFLPMVENDFVFEELDSWILNQAMTDGLRFLEKDPSFILGINLSSAQVEDEYFIDNLLQIAKRTAFPLKNLSFELTKSCRLLDKDRLSAVVQNLHSYGIHVIIDDFGSGLDSIGFMKELRPDFVKLDRDFIKDVEEDQVSRLTLEHLSQLASGSGVSVCVKGIENEKMYEIMRQNKIDIIQGNYFSEPLSVDAFLEKYMK